MVPTVERMMGLSVKLADVLMTEDATRDEGISALMWTIAASMAHQLYLDHAAGGKTTLKELMVPTTSAIMGFADALYQDLVTKGLPDATD